MIIEVFVYFISLITDSYFDGIYLRFAAYYFTLILILVTANLTLGSNLEIHLIQCRAAQNYLLKSSISYQR